MLHKHAHKGLSTTLLDLQGMSPAAGLSGIV